MERKTFSKVLSIVLALCLCLALLPVTALATGEMDGKTVVIYSGNIRGNIDILPQIAALKASYESKGAEVILADTGNFLQGTVYATYDSGKTVIELMAKAGYDVVAIGSHEFDFGTGKVGVEQHEVYYADDTLGKLLEDAAFSAVSANIFTGEGEISAFAPNAVVTTASGKKIGFFGITDPNTVNQALESNLSGLSFADGAQTATAQTTALSGCDLVVGLSNLGTETKISGTTILDVAPATSFFIGAVVIGADGKVESHAAIDLTSIGADAALSAEIAAFREIVNAEYPVVAKSEVTLEGSMAASRSGETNTGNLWTDALLWFATEGGIENYYDEDEIANGNTGISLPAENIVAVWNGGNLRDYLNTGDVTVKDLQRILPYPNRVAVVYLTGVQLLEMLESASQGLPYTSATSAAAAAFLQVAGIKYTVDAGVPYDAGEAYGNNWFKANSVRRASIQSINGKAFDADATYAVITSNAVANGMDSNYACLDKDADLSTITTATVINVVWMYINEKLGGVIGSEYAGAQGRITVDTAKTEIYTDVSPSAGYYDAVMYVTENGLMNGTGASFAPSANMTRAMFVTMLYRLAGSPEVDVAAAFTDVAAGAWYADAVAWAVTEGITTGVSDTAFAPDSAMTRQQMAAFIYRYYKTPEVSGELTFSDSGTIADWAKDAVLYCYEGGLMNGVTDTTFVPGGTANRAMGATVLARMHSK